MASSRIGGEAINALTPQGRSPDRSPCPWGGAPGPHGSPPTKLQELVLGCPPRFGGRNGEQLVRYLIDHYIQNIMVHCYCVDLFYGTETTSMGRKGPAPFLLVYPSRQPEGPPGGPGNSEPGLRQAHPGSLVGPRPGPGRATNRDRHRVQGEAQANRVAQGEAQGPRFDTSPLGRVPPGGSEPVVIPGSPGLTKGLGGQKGEPYGESRIAAVGGGRGSLGGPWWNRASLPALRYEQVREWLYTIILFPVVDTEGMSLDHAIAILQNGAEPLRGELRSPLGVTHCRGELCSPLLTGLRPVRGVTPVAHGR